MAEGYLELGLSEEAAKVVESLPPDLQLGAQLTLQRLASGTGTSVSATFSFAEEEHAVPSCC